MNTESGTIEAKWIEKPVDPAVIDLLVSDCGFSPLQARLLACRGVEDTAQAGNYLNPSIDKLHDPFMFNEMEKAVSIIEESVSKRETILIHGDFDADGVTGTAILYEFLSEIGADVRYFVPRRAKDGYGLAKRVMEKGVASGMKLVISVDCGASDENVIEFLHKNGVRSVITDHHEIGGRIGADAVINPKMPGEAYPFKELAGVGVAFKLIQAINSSLDMNMSMEDYLDLAALGTLGDYMSLTGENRILVSKGMEILKGWSRPGLEALRKMSRLNREDFTARQICFTIIPRLNSPGRVGSASDVVSLLIEKDDSRAREMALQIEEKNRERKLLDSNVTEEACYLADIYLKRDDPKALVFSSASWHEGVVGIGAARLAERYGLPSALIAVHDNGIGKGSVRSSGNIHIRNALEMCSEQLIEFGGHKEAGGFSVAEKDIAEFTEMFNIAVGKLASENVDQEVREVDAEMGTSESTMKLISFLEKMSPFGPGNGEPVFLLRNIEVGNDCRIVGKGHLKFNGSQGEEESIDFIGFSMGKIWRPHEIYGRRLDLLVNFRKNTFRGKTIKQFRVLAIRINEDQQPGDERIEGGM